MFSREMKPYARVAQACAFAVICCPAAIVACQDYIFKLL